VQVDARQYPVTVHFNRRTPEDYLEETVKKVSKLNTTLPEGGVLVFLTGQQEIEYVCRQLRERFGPNVVERRRRIRRRARQRLKSRNADMDMDEGDGSSSGDGVGDGNGNGDNDDEKAALNRANSGQSDDASMSSAASSGEDSSSSSHSDSDSDSHVDSSDSSDSETEDHPMFILPLYSSLPTHQQQRVFDEIPKRYKGYRLCIVSTNVAETSLTIPGISFVVDCGKEKQLRYNPATGVQEFVVDWISKASADQRAGRAGRTGPGHSYRLYSSNVFATRFEQFSPPEILLTPVDAVCLQMKAMGISGVEKFPFPTPPGRENMRAALRLLESLGAISPQTGHHGGSGDSSITSLGRLMAVFPVAPRFAKMLALAIPRHGVSPDSTDGDLNMLMYVVALVAALSVRDPIKKRVPADFDDDESSDDDDQQQQTVEAIRLKKEKRRKRFEAARLKMMQSLGQLACPDSDVLTTLKAVGAFEYACSLPGATAATRAEFCEQKQLDAKLMGEIHSLALQLRRVVIQVMASLDGNNSSGVAGAAQSDANWDGAKEAAEEGKDAGELALSERVLASSASSSSSSSSSASASSSPLPKLQSLPPPSLSDLDTLRRILCGGFIDHVARRVVTENTGNATSRNFVHGNNGAKSSSNARQVAYEMVTPRAATSKPTTGGDGGSSSSSSPDVAFIHPQSLLHGSPPEYVVFRDVRKAGDGSDAADAANAKPRKTFLHSITAVDPSWLVQLGGAAANSLKMLDVPAPSYDPASDSITCVVRSLFGPKKWALPPCHAVLVPHADDADAAALSPSLSVGHMAQYVDEAVFFRYFARMLLDGDVFPAMRQFRAAWATKPSVCVKGSTQHRVSLLIEQLREAGATSRKACEALWRREPRWLHAVVAQWLDRKWHTQLAEMWPPAPR
jgi:Helicase conserved C-terminal domain/Oligonucleotide/oligosaccharide-binding (OB)-fold/Helicase associated domain (HA2), ratchet-like/Helicase associated domain (HA2), winged-helix